VGREVLELEPELLQQQQEERRDRQRQPAGEVGDEQDELPGGEAAEGTAPARILPVSVGAPHPSRLRTRLSVASDWKRSGRTSEVMATAATRVWSRRARMQRGHRELEGERAQQLERMRKRNRCTRG
jgi:hypothetical protein